jgi:hypothetical protein
MRANTSRSDVARIFLSKADLVIVSNSLSEVCHPSRWRPRPITPVHLEYADSLRIRVRRDLHSRGWNFRRRRFSGPEELFPVRVSEVDLAVLILCVRTTLDEFGEDFDFQSRIGYKSGQTRKLRNRLQKHYDDLVLERRRPRASRWDSFGKKFFDERLRGRAR